MIKLKNLFLFIIFIFIYLIYIFCYIIILNFYKKEIDNIYVNLTILSESLVIFSCFYDKRYNMIRMIGCAVKKTKIICKYMFYNTKINCKYKYLQFKKDSSGLNFKSMYVNILIYLTNSNFIPKIITINNNSFDVNFIKKTHKNNVLCITTLKNFISYNLLEQTLQLYDYYGVTDVYLYSSDPILDLKKMKYLNLKLHIIFIQNEQYLSDTFYYGQIIKYNDCLYRNMYNSQYIIFSDFDEIIILNKTNSYYKLLYSFTSGDIFYFRSALCPTTKYIEYKRFHLLNDTSLIKTLRCCLLSSYYHRKYIIKYPLKFIKINIHYIDYVYEKSNDIYVKENLAYIHHSRIPTFPLLNNCYNWFYDNYLFNLITTLQ